MEGDGDVQAGIALADDSLCLGELPGAFLDAHGGLRLLMGVVRMSCFESSKCENPYR